jgi:lysyl-tRNA synthetase, class II
MTTETTPITADKNHVMAERREKLKAIRAQGVAFPNDYRPQHHAAILAAEHALKENEEFEANPVNVKISGRMMLKRVMGKASFATLQDKSGRIQLFISKENIGEEIYDAFKRWDLGDILAAEGVLFKTKTGELSVKVSQLRLLTKSLRPLPEKFHGLADQEIKYRQRYVDLIVSEETRQTFIDRSKIVAAIRNFMISHEFLEVETPMLHPIPGGATAKPFKTHHNALDMSMVLRIAPEPLFETSGCGRF